ncbi:MAG: 50S ribosomal protein L9 [Candidatus Sumerlaeota bacterium]
MEIILFETIPTLGPQGSIVSVAPGYFRNYLAPNGLAVQATEANKAALKDKLAKLERQAEEELKEMRSEAEKLADVELDYEMRAGEDGKLFGSVTTIDIAERLTEMGFTVDRHNIIVHEAIKSMGDHVAEVKLTKEVTAEVKIHVKGIDHEGNEVHLEEEAPEPEAAPEQPTAEADVEPAPEGEPVAQDVEEALEEAKTEESE